MTRDFKPSISISLTLLSLMICSPSMHAKDPCKAGGVRLKDIAIEAENASLRKTLRMLEKSSCYDHTNKKLKIDETLHNIVDDKKTKIDWEVSRYDETKMGFYLQTNLGQHYLPDQPFGQPTNTHDCPNNQLSSGLKIYSLEKSSLRIINSWSCGSQGCNYRFFFIENKKATIDDLCKIL